MFEQFTDRARRVMVLAQEEARQFDHPAIGTEHLLLGLVAEGHGVAAKALHSLGVDIETARAVVGGLAQQGRDKRDGPPPFTPRAKRVLELSLRESLQLGHRYIGTEHLLLGLVREGDGAGARVLEQLDAPLPAVRQRVIQMLSGYEPPGPQVGLTVSSPGDAPLCPHCSAGLAATAATSRLDVEGSAFTVVYCTACGKALAFKPEA